MVPSPERSLHLRVQASPRLMPVVRASSMAMPSGRGLGRHCQAHHAGAVVTTEGICRRLHALGRPAEVAGALGTARSRWSRPARDTSPCFPTRSRGPSGHWRPAMTGTPSRGASAAPGGCPTSARRACPPRGPWPASPSSCSSRSRRRRGCAGGCAGAASTGATRPGASLTGRGRPGAARGRATAPACARSPGGSATSSTGWATGCRPRHNSPGI